ncbi:hypothetical protein B296_00039300 [Ensete ventricosum]|uniref:Uncharacterized protein n=1 Tax=Ensete ventricosum TaxID=4639 RepID=A0A426WX36_ENSVE|nr:hypothetical protein B296_00039300 [Ensete ventricosum]
MAKPLVRATGQGLATCKGAAGCGQDPLQRGDRLRPRNPTRGQLDATRASIHPQAQPLVAQCSQGQLAVGHPQGATASLQEAAPAARFVASKGSSISRRSGCWQARVVVACVGAIVA